MDAKVDLFISKVQKWQQELDRLRSIILECGVIEQLKWRQPCYMFDNKNLLIITGLKDSFAISFFKGVLLKDEYNLLIKPGENSQSGRWMKFTSMKELSEKKAIIKAYIFEAIEIEKAGLKVALKKSTDLVLVPELQKKLKKMPALKKAFEALTPGRQRAYNIYFEGAKQTKTREDRIEKYVQRILNGKGILDCVCGLSKKMPTCDGSHKFIGK